MNDRERELWVRNDEGLYSWWRQSRLSMREFIGENRNELTRLIQGVIDAPPREKKWYDIGGRQKQHTIEPRGSDFAIDEYASGFEIVHKKTGKTHWMSDGVDMFFTSTGHSISPGTKAWENAARSMLIHEQADLYEAYFPELYKKYYE
jgi:hypothetical protein